MNTTTPRRTFGEAASEAMTAVTPPPQPELEPVPPRAAPAVADWPKQLNLRLSEEGYALIKAAYVADGVDHADGAPTSFVDWISTAIDEHARRTPQRRAQLAKELQRETVSRQDSKVRSFRIADVVWERIDAACVQERKAGLRAHGRTSFGQEAVAVAVQQVKNKKEQAGQTLRPIYDKLPRGLR